MLANGKKCKTYKCEDGHLSVTLMESINTALAFDVSTVTIETDEGSVIEVMSGYTKTRTSVDAVTGLVTVEGVLNGDLAKSVSSLGGAVKEAYTIAESANASSKEMSDQISALTSAFDVEVTE